MVRAQSTNALPTAVTLSDPLGWMVCDPPVEAMGRKRSPREGTLRAVTDASFFTSLKPWLPLRQDT